MANVMIRRVLRQQASQRSPLNWSGEEGIARDVSSVTRRLISSQPHAIDVYKEGREVMAATSTLLPWAWSAPEGARSVSQLVAPKSKRLFLVDTLALVRSAFALCLASLSSVLVLPGLGVWG
jgi:hypothetical protein